MNHIYVLWDEANVYDKSIMGNKGCNLMKMFQSGISVPPGLIIPTSVCKE